MSEPRCPDGQHMWMMLWGGLVCVICGETVSPVKRLSREELLKQFPMADIPADEPTSYGGTD